MRLAPNNFTAFAKCMTVPATLTPADICILASHYSHMGGAVAVWVARWLFGWRGGCLGGAVAVWVASRLEACRLSQLQGCGFESAPLTSIA